MTYATPSPGGILGDRIQGHMSTVGRMLSRAPMLCGKKSSLKKNGREARGKDWKTVDQEF